MQVIPTSIPDVLIIEPRVFSDDRGFFFESFHQGRYAEAGIDMPMVQSNHSGSRRRVLRGLHYQNPYPQGKLVSVIEGEVFDVAVDLRQSSATFGKWVGVRLSSDNRRQLWVPPGFAHGFFTMSEWAEVSYLVTALYNRDTEYTLLWNDPQVGIEWPVVEGSEPLLSPKDAKGAPLEKAVVFK
jgi:dTDP-4-dehydrorhamnose 3,5-epimerase